MKMNRLAGGVLAVVMTASALVMPVMATERDTVCVSAESAVTVVPDLTDLSFGVITEAEDAMAAQQENTEKIASITEKLKELGVDEKYIKTSYFNIYPRYDYSKGAEITGYEVNTTLEVSSQQVSLAGAIITACVEEGVNNVNNVKYTCSGYDEAYQEALKKAVADARKKAEALAEAGGKTLGTVNTIAEGYQNTTYRMTTNDAMYDAAETEMAVAYKEAGSSMDFMPGEAQIKASVTVTWYLED